ncbi:hypothetical protein BJ508DRAFT_377405 [Ascobolus immersus RN42]|uniref:Uncharacterized protein n=1 Tax=Ascobolus immersus RN42 TaxID=1160509 RepID=A0A3N4I171_ASCIM|nr:hypothetical protein BJ508DRAFT_377405 [Ascobolus immersus RN42]
MMKPGIRSSQGGCYRYAECTAHPGTWVLISLGYVWIHSSNFAIQRWNWEEAPGMPSRLISVSWHVARCSGWDWTATTLLLRQAFGKGLGGTLISEVKPVMPINVARSRQRQDTATQRDEGLVLLVLSGGSTSCLPQWLNHSYLLLRTAESNLQQPPNPLSLRLRSSIASKPQISLPLNPPLTISSSVPAYARSQPLSAFRFKGLQSYWTPSPLATSGPPAAPAASLQLTTQVFTWKAKVPDQHTQFAHTTSLSLDMKRLFGSGLAASAIHTPLKYRKSQPYAIHDTISAS